MNKQKSQELARMRRAVKKVVVNPGGDLPEFGLPSGFHRFLHKLVQTRRRYTIMAVHDKRVENKQRKRTEGVQKLAKWRKANPIKPTMLWRNSAFAQEGFFITHLAPLFSAGLSGDPLDRVSVISKHRSKSIDLPVPQFYREDLNLTLIFRDNFHNWKMSVISPDRLAEGYFDGLFYQDQPREPDYTGDSLNSVYFEGFPRELVFGYYNPSDKHSWSAELYSEMSVWATVFLLLQDFGVIKTPQGVPEILETYVAHGETYGMDVQDMMFVRDTLSRLIYAGTDYYDLPKKLKGYLPGWPNYEFERDGKVFQITSYGDGRWELKINVPITIGNMQGLAYESTLKYGTWALKFMGRYPLWTALFIICRHLSWVKPLKQHTREEHRAELDEGTRWRYTNELFHELFGQKVDMSDLPKEERHRFRTWALAEYDRQEAPFKGRTEKWWWVIRTTAKELRKDWQNIASTLPHAPPLSLPKGLETVEAGLLLEEPRLSLANHLRQAIVTCTLTIDEALDLVAHYNMDLDNILDGPL